MNISVLILTFNEADNIRDCLRSVSWSDDVVVLDSFSTDGTDAIAEAAGARVIRRAFTNFADQRNFGITSGHLKHEWVLHLDADELVTPGLHSEMMTEINTSIFDAFRIANKLLLNGVWLKHSSMYPCYQVRLGRRSSLVFEQVGHGQRETVPQDRIGTLAEPYLHNAFSKGLDDWFRKHNKYSTDEAIQALKLLKDGGFDLGGLFDLSNRTRRWRSMKQLSHVLPMPGVFRFIYMYFLRRGALDGVAGLHYCILCSIYAEMINLKIAELRRGNRTDGNADCSNKSVLPS